MITLDPNPAEFRLDFFQRWHNSSKTVQQSAAKPATIWYKIDLFRIFTTRSYQS